jgi:hypothetical protein
MVALKRFGEVVQLVVTPSSGHATLYMFLAARRFDEISALARRPGANVDRLAGTIHDMRSDTEAAISGVSDSPVECQPEILMSIAQVAGRQPAVLRALSPVVPLGAPASRQQALQT